MSNNSNKFKEMSGISDGRSTSKAENIHWDNIRNIFLVKYRLIIVQNDVLFDRISHSHIQSKSDSVQTL